MSIIKSIEQEIENHIRKAGYEIEEFTLKISDRPDLGDYQINDSLLLLTGVYILYIMYIYKEVRYGNYNK